MRYQIKKDHENFHAIYTWDEKLSRWSYECGEFSLGKVKRTFKKRIEKESIVVENGEVVELLTEKHFLIRIWEKLWGEK